MEISVWKGHSWKPILNGCDLLKAMISNLIYFMGSETLLKIIQSVKMHSKTPPYRQKKSSNKKHINNLRNTSFLHCDFAHINWTQFEVYNYYIINIIIIIILLTFFFSIMDTALCCQKKRDSGFSPVHLCSSAYGIYAN